MKIKSVIRMLAIWICLQFAIFAIAETIPLKDLKPSLREMFDDFLAARPDTYDYTFSAINCSDAELTKWFKKEIARLHEGISGNRMSMLTLKQTIASIQNRLAKINREEDELKRRFKESISKALKENKEGRYEPGAFEKVREKAAQDFAKSVGRTAKYIPQGNNYVLSGLRTKGLTYRYRKAGDDFRFDFKLHMNPLIH